VRVAGTPREGSQNRYIRWFNDWVKIDFTRTIPAADQPRYEAWRGKREALKQEALRTGDPTEFFQWLDKNPTPKMELENHVFLSGEDCYALRCALSHQGSDRLRQRARDALRRFVFTVEGEKVLSHMNKGGDELQVDVIQFCQTIIARVDEWNIAKAADPIVQ
jgi:hypothetical protein